MSHYVIVNFNCKYKELEVFQSIMSTLKLDLPKVKGCMSVEIYRNSDENNKFTMIECWNSQEDHKRHIDNLMNDGSLAQINNLLISPMDGQKVIKL